MRGIDDRHEYVALPFLRGLFDDAVLQPIRLHVDAKRYLCARGDGRLSGAEYWAGLSRTRSAASNCRAASSPTRKPTPSSPSRIAADAVRVRLWDDLAKSADASTPPLDRYLALAERLSCR